MPGLFDLSGHLVPESLSPTITFLEQQPEQPGGVIAPLVPRSGEDAGSHGPPTVATGAGRYQSLHYLQSHRLRHTTARTHRHAAAAAAEGMTALPAPTGGAPQAVSLHGSVGGFFDPAAGALGGEVLGPETPPADCITGVVASPRYRGSGAFFDPSGGSVAELRLPDDDLPATAAGAPFALSPSRLPGGRLCGAGDNGCHVS